MARRGVSDFTKAVQELTAERAALKIVPPPLDAKLTGMLVELLKKPPQEEAEFLMDQLANRVPPGVDEAAYVKAAFLTAIVKGEASSPLITKTRAVELLGTMQGGYNVGTLVHALDDVEVAPVAAEQLKRTLLVFEAFYDVEEKAQKGNTHAQAVLQSWADAEWFTARPKVAAKLTVTVFKVPGETNTDDLSPAPDAWSRPDIPLHALAMLKNPREGVPADVPAAIDELKAKGHPLVYVGDVVGTGSSRKSATNSVLWCVPLWGRGAWEGGLMVIWAWPTARARWRPAGRAGALQPSLPLWRVGRRRQRGGERFPGPGGEGAVGGRVWVVCAYPRERAARAARRHAPLRLCALRAAA